MRHIKNVAERARCPAGQQEQTAWQAREHSNQKDRAGQPRQRCDRQALWVLRQRPARPGRQRLHLQLPARASALQDQVAFWSTRYCDLLQRSLAELRAVRRQSLAAGCCETVLGRSAQQVDAAPGGCRLQAVCKCRQRCWLIAREYGPQQRQRVCI